MKQQQTNSNGQSGSPTQNNRFTSPTIRYSSARRVEVNDSLLRSAVMSVQCEMHRGADIHYSLRVREKTLKRSKQKNNENINKKNHRCNKYSYSYIRNRTGIQYIFKRSRSQDRGSNRKNTYYTTMVFS